MAAPRVEIPEVVLSSAGTPVLGASVQVNLRGSTAATVFAAETGGTTNANPIITDANGRIEGWLEEGSYDLVVSGTGLTTYTQAFEATRGSNSPGKILTTAGDILYASSANNIARLGIGSTGDLLKVAGGFPSWAAQATAALSQICDLTLSGTQASFDTNTILGGNIPSTYNHLELWVVGRSDTAATNTALNLRLNNDSTGNYDYGRLSGSNASAANNEAFAASAISPGDIPAASATANVPGSYVISIPNYAGTTFNKIVNAIGGYKLGTSAGNLTQYRTDGHWRSTAAITRITVLPNVGSFVAGSRFTLYGRI